MPWHTCQVWLTGLLRHAPFDDEYFTSLERRTLDKAEIGARVAQASSADSSRHRKRPSKSGVAATWHGKRGARLDHQQDKQSNKGNGAWPRTESF